MCSDPSTAIITVPFPMIWVSADVAVFAVIFFSSGVYSMKSFMSPVKWRDAPESRIQSTLFIWSSAAKSLITFGQQNVFSTLGITLVVVIVAVVLYPVGRRLVASRGEANVAHRELGPAELSKNISTSSVEQTRGQRQTGRNDLPGRVRELLMDGESREQEVLDHIHTPNVVYIQT